MLERLLTMGIACQYYKMYVYSEFLNTYKLQMYLNLWLDKEFVAVEPFSCLFSPLACGFGRFTVSSLLLSQWRCNATGVVDPDSFQVNPDPDILKDVQSKL
jgi:hypothetical protein